MKVAVVGSGIAGLASAWQLARDGHDVALFEAADYFGGHAHTVDVTVDGHRFGVDTGFLVFNRQTYPALVALFAELGVATTESDMSFSVRTPAGGRMLEWAGTNLDTVFAQRGNLLRPRFLGMLRDILRFNAHTTRLAESGQLEASAQTLGAFLDRHRYGRAFRDWYLLPMAGCIWSCPTERMLAFPLASFVRFCHNHGLLQVEDRPKWRTVTGGARHYVDKLLAAIPRAHASTPVERIVRSRLSGREAVTLTTRLGSEHFDHVVLATHSDQSLRLLHDPDAGERLLLEAVPYQPNRAVLHTDARCLPQHRKAWAAWNYEHGGGERVCVHYLFNRLQPLPCATPVIVSLNPVAEPDPATVLGAWNYAHPVFDAGAVAAQRRLWTLQGRRNTWFAGAWTGYGFHEDGLKSGLAVARAITRMGAAVLAAA
ncbi:FAD-dependent oxidoreductase [Oxalobacteraceae bacterium OM1]|nr:FAD-dependent oxidoreductase [Oxalobacteraceae bacterium OM1]